MAAESHAEPRIPARPTGSHPPDLRFVPQRGRWGRKHRWGVYPRTRWIPERVRSRSHARRVRIDTPSSYIPRRDLNETPGHLNVCGVCRVAFSYQQCRLSADPKVDHHQIVNNLSP
jgi:hypothetical protein